MSKMWRNKNEGLCILGVFFPTSPLISPILWRHMDHFWHNLGFVALVCRKKDSEMVESLFGTGLNIQLNYIWRFHWGLYAADCTAVEPCQKELSTYKFYDLYSLYSIKLKKYHDIILIIFYFHIYFCGFMRLFGGWWSLQQTINAHYTISALGCN